MASEVLCLFLVGRKEAGSLESRASVMVLGECMHKPVSSDLGDHKYRGSIKAFPIK